MPRPDLEDQWWPPVWSASRGWLKDNQKASGVFETVSTLVQSLVDNPAAKMTAQEILDRVQRAQRLPTSPCTGPGCTVQVP